MLGGLRMVADVDLSPWASGATIAAAVVSIITAIAIGLVWLGRQITAKIEASAKETKDKFESHAATVKDRFDSQDDEQATFRDEILEVVAELRATDKDHDRRITRVETRMDEHDKIHSRTWVSPSPDLA